ncbi:MAG: hypothetical protein ACPGLV_19275, partial [Bacteroidia bacterium]
MLLKRVNSDIYNYLPDKDVETLQKKTHSFNLHFEEVTNAILNKLGKFHCGDNTIIHFRLKNSTDSLHLEKTFSPGNKVFPSGFYNGWIDFNDFLDLGLVEQNKLIVSILKNGFDFILTELQINSEEKSRFFEAIQSFENDGYLITTKPKWNKFRQFKWHFEMLKGTLRPYSQLLVLENKNEEILRYEIDKITEPQPVDYWP